MSSITVVAAVLFLAGIYKFIMIPAFLSPLSKIPCANPIVPISSLWIWWIRRIGTETRTIFALHCRLGPIVRLGPNEISVNSAIGLRTVYQGGFEKHPWYRAFDNYQEPCLFSMVASKPHSQQKRAISHVYSKSYLQKSSDLQRLFRIILLDRFLPILNDFALQGAEVNVLELAQSVAMDMISGYTFGSSNATDFLRDVKYRDRWLKTYSVFKNESPEKRQGGETERSCVAMCEAAKTWLGNSDKETVNAEGTRPVVYEQFSQRLQKSSDMTQPKASMRVAASEFLDHLIAGHETTGITLTYLMYEMSLRPKMQSTLRETLRDIFPPCRDSSVTDDGSSGQQIGLEAVCLPASQTLDNLPLLDAILKETLRLHQAAPAPQPRVTPHTAAGVDLEGHHSIPGGVRVSSNAYTLHRNPAVFPDPETWQPERWLDAKEAQRIEMNRWFWAFSSGGRMCLGSHFAVQEMKMIVAAIYTNFETFVVDDEGIEQADTYVAGPVGNKLILRFQRV